MPAPPQHPAAPDVLRHWVRTAAHAVGRHAESLNAINVFPIADSDTGSNVALTLAAGEAASKDGDVRAFTRAMTLAALGNSGTITSQFFRGVATAMRDGDLTTDVLRDALVGGSDAAKNAVPHPVDGTILTVMAATANAATQHDGTALDDLYTHVLDAAHTSLHDTPSYMPLLADMGLVDAGAAAYVIILDALGDTLGYERPALPHLVPTPDVAQANPSCEESGSQQEVHVTFRSDAAGAVAAREAAQHHGDSIVVIGEEPEFRMHVHSSHPDALIAALAEVVTVDHVTAEPIHGDE